MPDIPRIGTKTGLKITKALFPGVVYVAKKVSMEALGLIGIKEVPLESELLVKIIYSGLAKERYGQDVHKCLSEKDMAPHYYTPFSTKLPSLPRTTLEMYHVMEYLPPPEGASMGWMTLYDLGRSYPAEAAESKHQISGALNAILEVLRSHKFVHGDFRTNNVLVFVEIKKNSLDGPSIIIQPNPKSKSVAYLKVVDFDWAGIAGKVRYPSIRNPDIHWPGANGKTIDINHDEEMINHWMVFWPKDPQPVQVPEEVGFVEE